jgi:hypothetical protein
MLCVGLMTPSPGAGQSQARREVDGVGLGARIIGRGGVSTPAVSHQNQKAVRASREAGPGITTPARCVSGPLPQADYPVRFGDDAPPTQTL